VLALLNGVPTWAATSTLATITGTLGVGSGGTGANTFSYGLVLSPGGTGVLTNIATSSLGLLTTNVAEGSNLYYTDARVQLPRGAQGFFFSHQLIWKPAQLLPRARTSDELAPHAFDALTQFHAPARIRSMPDDAPAYFRAFAQLRRRCREFPAADDTWPLY
jgi:hypothetical protein